MLKMLLLFSILRLL